MPDSLLIVFVKAPRPGEVKTRLAADIGPEAACGAYHSMVRHLWRHIGGVRPVQLRFAPDDASAELDPWLQPGWGMRPQGPGNLGQRLSTAFAEAFREGFTKVAVIGSDCPEVTRDDIENAWDRLDHHDLVVGPASDGGYWLLGLDRHHPELFQGIAWSTDKVLTQTLARAESLRLKTCCLRTLTDVDSAEDWKRFLAAAGHGEGEEDAACRIRSPWE